MAGNFLELIVNEFLMVGDFKKCRRLLESEQQTNSSVSYEARPTWSSDSNKLTTVQKYTVDDMTVALQDCRDASTMYHFCRSFATIDYSARDFRYNFHVSDTTSQSIDLQAIRAVCNHVRSVHGEEEKVRLMFLVPDAVADTWVYSQSFSHAAGEVHGVTSNVSSKYADLPEDARADLRNLEQWVVYYE